MNHTIFSLLYGSWLRVNECLRIRVQDLTLNNLSLTVRDEKGKKDRMTLLSPAVITPLKLQIKKASSIQKNDNKQGIGPSLPNALGKKYPNTFRRIKYLIHLRSFFV
ncbi:tyrosine-type recombinase/integrase [Vibrio salinus]|uniref:tyrosine-type recombinase/integrase n=1 Tax=Vibrio salinus TaxID=2899784 RepID=UPI001E551294|nr:tyrosine-type recombinase/integrase [Vibrio salinus]MCE0495180.1 tyrosine-type recombinase/integrase [Vibrio salinus]